MGSQNMGDEGVVQGAPQPAAGGDGTAGQNLAIGVL